MSDTPNSTPAATPSSSPSATGPTRPCIDIPISAAPRCLNNNAMFVPSADPNANANPAVIATDSQRAHSDEERRSARCASAIVLANSECMGRKCGKLRDALSEPRLFSLSGRCLPIRRAERRLAVATAAMKARTNTGANGGTVVAPESVSMEFLIVEDNGGHFHWTLLDRDG